MLDTHEFVSQNSRHENKAHQAGQTSQDDAMPVLPKVLQRTGTADSSGQLPPEAEMRKEEC